MDGALAKTLTLILFIVIGVLIRKKFSSREQVNGIKNMILTIALPATIFVALMGVEVKTTMLVYPLAALVFNFMLYFVMPRFLMSFGINPSTKEGRTLRLLLPSLAPGLSCFPFVIEFLGESELAIAALADVGNKVFVLLFLYIVAMNMFLSQHPASNENGKRKKMKSLIISLVKEPINMVIFVAIGLIMMGVQLTDLPLFIASAFERMGSMMTPLVLIFIGLAVTVSKNKLVPIFGILLSRSGISLVLVSLMLWAAGVNQSSMILLSMAFALSSCSFWPFAHMASFTQKEDDLGAKNRIFDLNYGLLVLAISLPVSTLLILGVLNSGTFFTNHLSITILGVGLTLLGLIPRLIERMKRSFRMSTERKMQGSLKPVD